MNQELEAAIDRLRELQRSLCDEERVVLWDILAEGYCTDCGRKIASTETCLCNRDE